MHGLGEGLLEGTDDEEPAGLLASLCSGLAETDLVVRVERGLGTGRVVMACTAAISDDGDVELWSLVCEPSDDKCDDELFMPHPPARGRHQDRSHCFRQERRLLHHTCAPSWPAG